MAFTWLGKFPVVLNALSCCSGMVSHAASSAASFGCLLCFGTVRNEPPQLPAPPGNAAVTAHLSSFSGPDCASMTPSIHDGQVLVAKAAFLNAVFHSLLKATSLADCPLRTAAVTWSQSCFTAVLDSRTNLSSR